MASSTETTPQIETLEELKKEIKRLKGKSVQMQLDLHDLAEELPTDFEKIPETAAKTYEVFRRLDELQKQLSAWRD